MKWFLTITLLLVLTAIVGCVFDMNDDYEKTVTNNGGSGTGEGYAVSGVIVDNKGQGLSGLTVVLDGAPGETATTDAGGSFEFTDISNGSYSVKPPESKYGSMPITVAGADVFVGTVRSGGHGASKSGDYSCAQCH